VKRTVKKTARRAAVILTVLALAAPALTVPAAAQVKPTGSGEVRGPISISADRLEADDTAGVIQFIGAVVARQDNLTLTCDRMKVFYISPPPGRAEAESSLLASGGREIDRVEGFGQVKMVDGQHQAVGDHALYLTKNTPRRLILTGDARVWQGRDSLAGHRITYFLDERRGVVESAPRQRVGTVINGGEAAAR
jgi:lipopolysaccharide export system protein LptA